MLPAHLCPRSMPDTPGALNVRTGATQIYSWQGINALELWARVLGAHAGQPALRPLVHPLIQVSAAAC